MAARRAGAGTLLWAADAWLVDALAERLDAAHGCVALLAPQASVEQGGPGERRWTLPAPPGEAETRDCVARIFTGLGRVGGAVVETALVAGEADADWERALGDRLWRSFAVARAVAACMQAAGEGRIALLALDRVEAAPSRQADVARAGVVTMAQGLAKAFGDRTPICAVVSGPVEEVRPSGRRSRFSVSAELAADALAGLLESRAWATGSVFHLGSG